MCAIRTDDTRMRASAGATRRRRGGDATETTTIARTTRDQPFRSVRSDSPESTTSTTTRRTPTSARSRRRLPSFARSVPPSRARRGLPSERSAPPSSGSSSSFPTAFSMSLRDGDAASDERSSSVARVRASRRLPGASLARVPRATISTAVRSRARRLRRTHPCYTRCPPARALEGA